MAVLVVLAGAIPVLAQQQITGLVRLTGEGVSLLERRGRIALEIDLSQAVPWRVFTLDDPRRVLLDF
ncbi:MAG TPA: N-acetylmuramoyl-L-alanine amidase, partial [Rhodobacterales bacterium]|nr:N-acetylmuramoyl-L-alanine amidase [Rhodobacterales bacterium]